jgi:putative (di)nucleoside polyphosphate hydrolase
VIQKRTSCGVLVTDGSRLLLGHATRSPRWDLPKGIAELGESFVATAVRELYEETGLQVDSGSLQNLGVHAYLRDKDLALFAYKPAAMPDPASLHCLSLVRLPSGATMPELDRFGIFGWDEALALVGRNLARVLLEARHELV